MGRVLGLVYLKSASEGLTVEAGPYAADREGCTQQLGNIPGRLQDKDVEMAGQRQTANKLI